MSVAVGDAGGNVSLAQLKLILKQKKRWRCILKFMSKIYKCMCASSVDSAILIFMQTIYFLISLPAN